MGVIMGNAWISVDERMPEERQISDELWVSDKCLVAYGENPDAFKKGYKIGLVAKIDNTSNGKWRTDNELFKVFFWMPLPEPPKVEIYGKSERKRGGNFEADERVD